MRSIASAELHAGEPAPAFSLSEQPVSAPIVGSNLSVRLQDFQSEKAIPSGRGCNLTVTSSDPPPACTYGSDPDAPSVALVGDSHAAQWAPGLEEIADAGDIFLTAHVRSGCTIYDRTLTGELTESRDCLSWKDDVIELLHEEQPEVILIANSVGQTLPEAYDLGMRELLPELPEESRVVLIRDTPAFPGDPMACLSGSTGDPDACSVSREDGFKPGFREVDDGLLADFDLVEFDFTDYVCNADSCPPIQGDVLVFKDSHHISQTFSREMAPVLAEALAEALPAP
nr:SGNH hydrolase domain-containing protein [Leucobacter weissii]